MREYLGERLFDLFVDFWDDCWEDLDRIQEKVSFKPVQDRATYLFKLNSN
jgi:hypothetical protein